MITGGVRRTLQGMVKLLGDIVHTPSSHKQAMTKSVGGLIVLATLVTLGSILSTQTIFAAQKAATDPNRDINSSYFTTGNDYYLSLQNGQHWLYGQCTWYVWGRCAESGWRINYTGNANGFYDNVQNSSGKDMTPQIGDIMCLPLLDPAHGHVSVVVQVNNYNSWVVDEYNINAGAPDNVQWSREMVTRDPNDQTRVRGELFNWTTLRGFVHSPSGDGGFDPTNPYVDNSYSGSELGTVANPFKTVKAAINAASSTQATIHIKPGLYGEKVSTSKHIHFVTNGPGTVRIGG